MLILITTLGRAKKQKAVHQIPVHLHHLVRVFTQESEVAELQANLPATIDVYALPNDTDGIAQTRQRAIDALPRGKVWVIDDLCVFKKRSITSTRIEYKVLDDAGFVELYDLIEHDLDKYIQVGVSPHNGNNRCLVDSKPIGRVYSSYGLRTDMMQRANIRFDAMYEADNRYKFMEDFYITLDALTKGYANTVIYSFCFLYAHNTSGGNSTNRTLDGHSASAHELQRRFPAFVKCIAKEGTWGTQGMTRRVEIVAQWRKAYAAGVKTKR